VDAYCLGNEGLEAGRYSLALLERRMRDLRSKTGRPVTTTEASERYDERLLALGDWVFPNAHAYWAGILDPSAAAAWTRDRLGSLAARSGRAVIFKEVGFPTGGVDGVSEESQDRYFRSLEELPAVMPQTAFVFFEAFDQPWKNRPYVESHWGLFDRDRNPKKAAKPQILLSGPWDASGGGTLSGRVVNADPRRHAILVQAHIDGAWRNVPGAEGPLAPLRPDGGWVVDLGAASGGGAVSRVCCSLVPRDYPPAEGALPQISDTRVAAQVCASH
jgi:hypothetical protein